MSPEQQPTALHNSTPAGKVLQAQVWQEKIALIAKSVAVSRLVWIKTILRTELLDFRLRW